MQLVVSKRHPALRWKRLARVLDLFVPYLREHWRLMGAALACGVGATAMQLLRPWPIKILFDVVLMPSSAGTDGGWLNRLADLPQDRVIAGAALGLLVVAGLWGLFSYGQAYLTASAGQRIVFALRRRVHNHLMYLSLRFHQGSRRGDLLMRLTGDINVLRDLVVDALLIGIAQSFMLAAMVVVMLIMDWPMALIAIAVLPLLALTTFRFSLRIRESARRQRRNEGRVAALASETLGSIATIQAHGKESYQDSRFKKSNKMSLKAGLKTTRLEASMARLVEVLLAAGVAAVLWYGVHRVQAGLLTAGDLLVFISYVQASYRPMRRLARVSGRASKAVACGERLREVLKSEPEIQDQARAKKLREVRGPLEIRNISFGYDEKQMVLRKISFTAEPGSVTAIVGPSGAGKSTIMALALRLFDPADGKILIDGKDIRKYRVQSLRDQIGVVLQDPVLFGGTVKENIAYGVPDATPEAIEQAAALANADDFIRALPRGYETHLAESGANLSGGQRQRIAIARAFLRDAPILLLDEPTFGLDGPSEEAVMEALFRLVRGRTTLLIAHKLSAVRKAEQILVLRRGKIRERGTHEELLAAGDWYARTWEMQSSGRDRGVSSNDAGEATVHPSRSLR